MAFFVRGLRKFYFAPKSVLSEDGHALKLHERKEAKKKDVSTPLEIS